MVRSVMQARAGLETEILLFEDLHWFDGGSDAFLDVLFDLSPNARGLFLVNFRPEYRAAWMAKSYYQQIALLPLGVEATRELLHDLLGREPSLGRLAETIHARTAGNPFFIEEVVQSLIESGKLGWMRGAYRLVAPLGSSSAAATRRPSSLSPTASSSSPTTSCGTVQSYRELGGDYFERLNVDRLTRYHSKRLAALGYTVTLTKRAA